MVTALKQLAAIVGLGVLVTAPLVAAIACGFYEAAMFVATLLA